MKSKMIKIIMCLAVAVALMPVITFAQPVKEAQAANVKPAIIVTCANTGKVTLEKGTKYNFKVKASEGSKLTYKSSKKSVITVSKKGVLKAKNLGKSTITIKAKRSGKTAAKKIKVTVIKRSKYKKVKKISASIKYNNMAVGEIGKVKVKFNPSDASNKNLIYKVSDKSVVSVDASGTVVAKKKGTVKITVISCDGLKKSTIPIRVSQCGDNSLGGWIIDYSYWYSSANRVHPTVTVQGVIFDLSNWKNEVVMNTEDISGFGSFEPLTDIDINDISYEISGATYSAYDFTETYEGSDWSIGTEYFVGGEKDCIAYVMAGYDPTMYCKHRVELYNLNGTGEFTITVFYKGDFLADMKVKVEEPWQSLINNIEIVRLFEKEAWGEGMTDLEKLSALSSYIADRFTYKQCRCTEGAYYMMLAARYDLGLENCYYERSTKNNGVNDSITRYTGGACFVGGHVYLVTYIDGKRYEWNVQGYKKE